MLDTHPQDAAYTASLAEPESFWAHQAEQLSWAVAPKTTITREERNIAELGGTLRPHWRWFPDGEISTSFNCVDRHVEAGNGARTAIVWDSPVTGTKQKISYAQLADEVATLAGVLREEGVQRGDVVLVYMPMIPAAIVGVLATARLGAIHAVVFGGFSASSLAQRVDASKPRVILTASCGIEGAKGPLPYRPMVRGAVEQARHKPAKTLVWQREQSRWDPVLKGDGERNWQSLVKSARNRGLKAENVAVNSNEGLYIIYTSGTTGAPKGVLREAGGHAVGLNFSIRHLFGIKPGDVMLTASDIGWVVGHSYIIYAPLLAGATTVLFEGKPVGTPDAGTFWRLVEEHRVNVLFTAPTALRAIKREDGSNKHLVARGEKGGLKSLRALFLAGERSEPAVVTNYAQLLGQYGAPGATVVDNWWSSESGSPISGIAQLSSCARDFGDVSGSAVKPLSMRPGSAGKPLPGFDVRVVDDGGNEVPKGETGNIVLGMPLAPTGLTTLWKDEKRFYNGYLKRFGGKWLDTGDAGIVDEDGYVHIHGRSDDMINVAAHRLSTAALEQAITGHPLVIDACVIPVPDTLKGHVPFAFVALSSTTPPEDELLPQLNERVRHSVGAIATLGGVIAGQGIIPRTRSGKTLRRVLRQIVEDRMEGKSREVEVPATIEDREVVERAKAVIGKYFDGKGRESKL